MLLVEYFTPCLTRKLANNDPFSAIVSLVSLEAGSQPFLGGEGRFYSHSGPQRYIK